MRSIMKMLGLAFMATLAFSAIGAVGAGSASALLFLTLNNGLELVLLLNLNTANSPAILEQANGNSVRCPGVLGHGFVKNLSDLIEKFLFTFHECTSAALGGASCQSAGEPSGLITTLDLHALLITTLNTPAPQYGLLLLAEKGNLAEFECGGVQIQVKGSVVGAIEATGEKPAEQEEYKVTFAKGTNPGEPAEKTYWTLESTHAAKLESNADLLGTFEEANEQAVGDMKFEKKVGLCHKPSGGPLC